MAPCRRYCWGCGRLPAETITTEHKRTPVAEIAETGVTRIGGVIPVPLTERDIDLHPDITLPTHLNGMTRLPSVSWPPRLIWWAEGSSSRKQTMGNSGPNIHAQLPSRVGLGDCWTSVTASTSISEAALRNETCCRTDNEVRAALAPRRHG